MLQAVGDDETFTTQFAYDGLDRLIQTIDSSSSTNRVSYDSRNNPTLTIDALGNQVRTEYDGLNRALRTIRDLNGNSPNAADVADIITAQTWDDTSRLTSQIDDNGNATRYVYDSLSRKVAEVFADGTTNSVVFDVHDNPITKRDANGNVVTCQYDLLNRQLRKDVVVGALVSSATTFEVFQYDGLSRLIHAEDNDSLVTRAYDSLSHVTREVQNGKTVTCVYDGVGNETQCVYPGGRVITKTYDELERQKTISDSNGLIARYDYVGPSRVARRTYGNGTQCDYTYDGITGVLNPAGDFGVKNLIRTRHIRTNDNFVIDDRRYTWDRMGNKTTKSNLVNVTESRVYNYDPIYRLTRSVVSNQTVNYFFDGVGNRTNVTGGISAGLYTLSATTPEPADRQMNQYSSTPFGPETHDRNGNLKSSNGGTRQYTYDYRNQMVGFTDSTAGTGAEYKYDALGRRIARIVNDGLQRTIRYFYSGWQVVEERDASDATAATYAYGNYIDEVLTMQRSGTNYFYHTDDLYSVAKVTDGTGTIVESYRYDDYGLPTIFNQSQLQVPKSQIGNSYLFTGREFDTESSYYEYRTRYYDPDGGRFVSRDSVGIWGDESNVGNSLSYIGNEPISGMDPYGEFSFRGRMQIAALRLLILFSTIDGLNDLNSYLRDPVSKLGQVDEEDFLPREMQGGRSAEVKLQSRQIPRPGGASGGRPQSTDPIQKSIRRQLVKRFSNSANPTLRSWAKWLRAPNKTCSRRLYACVFRAPVKGAATQIRVLLDAFSKGTGPQSFKLRAFSSGELVLTRSAMRPLLRVAGVVGAAWLGWETGTWLRGVQNPFLPEGMTIGQGLDFAFYEMLFKQGDIDATRETDEWIRQLKERQDFRDRFRANPCLRPIGGSNPGDMFRANPGLRDIE